MGRTLKYEGAGGFYRQDDRTGFPQRAYRTKKEWTGLIVDENVWEPRQPQDLVKGVRDNQTVQEPRPIGPSLYDGPIYIATNANVAIGATFIPLGSIAGLTAGDSIGIMMDNGIYFNTTISGNPISTGVNIAAPMPYTAASGNLMIDYSANPQGALP
jgi:hypothetical protein